MLTQGVQSFQAFWPFCCYFFCELDWEASFVSQVFTRETCLKLFHKKQGCTSWRNLNSNSVKLPPFDRWEHRKLGRKASLWPRRKCMELMAQPPMALSLASTSSITSAQFALATGPMTSSVSPLKVWDCKQLCRLHLTLEISKLASLHGWFETSWFKSRHPPCHWFVVWPSCRKASPEGWPKGSWLQCFYFNNLHCNRFFGVLSSTNI